MKTHGTCEKRGTRDEGSEQRWRATPGEMAMTGLGYGNGTMLPLKRWGGGVAGKARERLERGQGEVLRRHPSRALVPGLPLLREGGGRQGDLSASASPPCERPPPHHSQSFSVLPAPSKHCCPHFPSPVNFSRQEISPFFPGPESQKQYTRSRNSKGTAQPSRQKHLWA